jgi:hypothetical protein
MPVWTFACPAHAPEKKLAGSGAEMMEGRLDDPSAARHFGDAGNRSLLYPRIKEGPAVWEAGPSTCGVQKARVASRNASNSGAPRAVPVTLTKKSDCDFAATKDGVS